MTFEQQRSSIGFRIRCYNVVPWKSDAFVAVRNGNTDRLKSLFSTGQATPFDISVDGSSLLNIATSFCHVQTCKLLIDQGAEIDYVDHTGKSALHDLTTTFVFDADISRPGFYEYYKASKQTIIELLELLAELVPRDQHDWEELEAGFPMHPVYFSAMKLLLRGHLNVQLLSHEDRAEMILMTDSLGLIKELLGLDLSAREVFTYAKTHGLPYRERLEYYLRKSDKERRPWSWYIQELLAVDQSPVDEYPQHPIDSTTSIVGISLYHTAWLDRDIDLFSDLQRGSNLRLHSYLTTLQNLGADLEILGQKEQYMFLQHGWIEPHWYSKRPHTFYWRMTGLNIGSCVTDWKIWLAPHSREYELAGQFWDGIENPELYMPGAFIEDEV